MDRNDFMLLREAGEKLNRGDLTLTAEERRVVDRYGISNPRTCGNEECLNELGPRFDGEHHKIQGVEVCESCHFDSIGKVRENFPSLPEQIRRGP